MLRRVIDATRFKMAQDPSRGVVRLVAVATAATVVLFTPGAASAAKPGTTLATFDTPGAYTWTVPHGVKQARFDIFGAAGGAPQGQLAALGGEANATFDVRAGQVFEILVGGAGSAN